MNCPACGAPINVKPDTEGFKCDYCHAVFFPGEEEDGVTISAVPSSADQASCPVCSIPLVQASIGKIPLQYCSECHGLLLPMRVLPALIDELRARQSQPAVQTAPDKEDLKRAIHCPQCSRRMDTHFYAGPGNVILDSCADCRLVWLDRGEPTRIASAPDQAATADLERS